MEQDALFSLEPERPAEGPVVVDETFATAARTWLDETSWVDHVPGWLTGDRVLMAELQERDTWVQRRRWMYTREVVEPRLTAEHPVLAEVPFPVVRHLGAVLSRRYDRPYARLWINWYRDHDDSTGWHADKPAARASEAVVPVLSLGATRRFRVRPAAGGPATTYVVQGGDLVVMGGRCQRDFVHDVPKERTPTGARLSLNFSVAP
ncbi:alpha-ketoglutarate-dependent dioxygenase AlkB [Nocardioides litoris]|uniref:alpha-ketoglutarate-dependent dioxygenase AlkB n=1 Tax=Nocardioides litoris TaxID=1926648 RepID=UPI00111EBDF7|nr:alpha-ketoglutarate-dependent dioxygenase AlkB [Nocardioides litoris]